MPYELLVGLEVTDESAYQAYRDAITPMLHARGGDFGYDFRIAEVLKSRTSERINRVFTIFFPDLATKEAFFSDVAYIDAKQEYFEGAVESTTVIAEYERH